MTNETTTPQEDIEMCPDEPGAQCLIGADVVDLRAQHAKLVKDVNEFWDRLRIVEKELARQGALSVSLEQRLERIASSLDATRDLITAKIHELSLLISGNATASSVQHAADVQASLARDERFSKQQVKFVSAVIGSLVLGAGAVGTLFGVMFKGAAS